MSELLIAEAAEEEYTSSLKWYAERSKKAAERFEAEFAKALNAIAADPERYPLCDDYRHRIYLLNRYPFQHIYRKIDNECWLIVAVAHTSRKPLFGAEVVTQPKSCKNVRHKKSNVRPSLME